MVSTTVTNRSLDEETRLADRPSSEFSLLDNGHRSCHAIDRRTRRFRLSQLITGREQIDALLTSGDATNDLCGVLPP